MPPKTRQEWIQQAILAWENDHPGRGVLTANQGATLLWAMGNGREITFSQADHIVAWAENLINEREMLELVFSGRIGIAWDRKTRKITFHELSNLS